jgi:hypothetical protein
VEDEDGAELTLSTSENIPVKTQESRASSVDNGRRETRTKLSSIDPIEILYAVVEARLTKMPS